MSQTTLLTREPVVNKNRAITANRLIAHGPSIASVAEALASQAEVWPTHHPVFVSLGRLVPTPELMQWTIPDNAAIEIPAQTLAHRRARARDGAVDSPFTTLVLGLEQAKLDAQAPKASLILSKEGELLTYDAYLQAMGRHLPRDGVMLNAYPDSLDGTLAGLAAFVQRPEVAGAFRSLYLLPSVFNSDLDRGFSVIDYGLNDLLAKPADLEALAAAGLDLKFDFILNHASVLSPQFQDILARGERSPYNDFFIDWNAFWAGHGEMTPEGYIQPRADLIEHMFFRKPGLPLLMVRLPDGSEKPFWNTFYQEVRYPRVDAQDLMAAGLQYASADELATRVNATIADGTAQSFQQFVDASLRIKTNRLDADRQQLTDR